MTVAEARTFTHWRILDHDVYACEPCTGKPWVWGKVYLGEQGHEHVWMCPHAFADLREFCAQEVQ